MIIDLTDTNASAVANALLDIRKRSGSPTVGMVMTLVVVTGEAGCDEAIGAAMEAAKEHPCRILTVINGGGRERPRLDAEVNVGGDNGMVESVLLRMRGPLGRHADSVVLPLLLPDTPVVVWWPGTAPADVADTPLGRLAQRRITDAASAPRPTQALAQRAAVYAPGDTDFAWTRLTPWRTLVAASLDLNPGRVRAVEVAAERGNASADLLGTWLGTRLAVPVTHVVSAGPGITGVAVTVPGGQITIDRSDGQLGSLNRPGDPERRVALQRRGVPELLVEELRRLDPDDVYEETLRAFAKRAARGGGARKRTSATSRAAERRAEETGAPTATAARRARKATRKAAGTAAGKKAAAKKAAGAGVARKAATTSAARTSPAAKKTATRTAAKKATAKKATATQPAAKKAAAARRSPAARNGARRATASS